MSNTCFRLAVPFLAIPLAVVILSCSRAVAQEVELFEPPDTSVPWIELRGERVWVYVPERDEAQGREVLARAERSARLVAERFNWIPSAPVRLVVNDISDDPNGFAVPFPYPQVQIFLSAPREGEYLSGYDDWIDLLVRHELTHIHHLDRTEGWASIPRFLFGNAPGLGSPGASVPVFVIEGLAVWQESKPDNANAGRIGRVVDPLARGLIRAAALRNALPQPDEVSVLGVPYPGGLGPYLYGAAFIDYLDRTCPEGAVEEMVVRHSRKLVPFLIEQSISQVCGRGFRELWDAWHRELRAEAASAAASKRPPSTPLPIMNLEGHLTGLRWLRQGIMVRGLDPDRGLRTWYLDPDTGSEIDSDSMEMRYPGRFRSVVQPPEAGGAWLIERVVHPRPGVHLSSLFRWTGEKLEPFEGGLRGFEAAVHPGGNRWAFVRNRPPVTELLVGDGTSEPVVVRAAESGVVWSSPSFSPDGKHLIAARRRAGVVQLVLMEATAFEEQAVLGFTGARNIQPVFLPNGWIVFSSDVSGVFNVYVVDPQSGETGQLTDAVGGALDPAVSPDGSRVAYREYLGRGEGVSVVRVEDAMPVPGHHYRTGAPLPLPPVVPVANVEPRPYSPWPMFLPRFWLPLWAQTPNDFLVGGFTGGQDILRRGFWSGTVYWGLNSEAPRAFFTAGGHRLPVPGRPLPYVQFSRDLVSFGRARVPRIGSGGSTIEEERDLWNDRVRVSGGFTTSAALSVAQVPFLEDARQGLSVSATAFYERRRDFDGALTALAASRPGVNPELFRALDLVGTRIVADYSSLQYSPQSPGPRKGINLSAAAEGVLKEAGSDRTGANVSVDGRVYLPVPFVSRQSIALRSAAGTSFKPRIMVRPFVLGGPIGEGPAVLTSGRIPLLRGYPDASFAGDRFLAFNAEYRWTLWRVHRGIRTLPLHLDSIRLIGFFDAGQAWDRGQFDTSRFSKGTGGEVWMDGRVLYYLPMRVRLSIAKGLDSGGETAFRVIIGSTF
ncbi:MAG: PD40 domain-containing protein [Deltaproteobacteria bacterium]|nr:PD40 domain-containing protein [Deltaproteobacteria bacterium]